MRVVNTSSIAGTARCGFSLIELLIALAILTTVTALVLPSLRSPLDRSRMRSAAVDVSNTWGKARRLAITEGRTLSFRCRLQGRHWKIEHSQLAGDLGGSDSGPSLPDARQTQDTPASTLIREGWLPEGVKFDALQLPSSLNADLSETSGGEETASEESLSGAVWSGPLNFRPEGRSEDARLRLAGANGLIVDVKMRGLTAAVAYTPPFRQTASQQTGDGQ